MADLDNFLEEEKWDDDNDSLPQDPFSSKRFDTVAPLGEDEKEAPVNSRKKLAEIEKENRQEELELKQARQLQDKPKPYEVKSPSMSSPPVVYEKPAPKSPPPSKITPAPKVTPAASAPSPAPAPAIAEASGEHYHDPAFEGRYSAEVVEFFSAMNKKTLTEQAVEYLNAYWSEVGDQAEFIFSVAIKTFREADMHRQGISLYYKYDEGSNVDYATYLYFYEKLVKFVEKNPVWRTGQFEKSAVYEVKTAVKHKNDLKEKVDVNFDGRISFLEFLLYQYNVFSNPVSFMERAKAQAEEHPAITAARLALQKVNDRIRAYEEERARLQTGAKEPGVKGLAFKHQLTMLDVSPLSEQLNESLITAEAAVRLAVKKFNGMSTAKGSGNYVPQGALWWMQRDLEEKKRVMVPNTLRRVKKNK